MDDIIQINDIKLKEIAFPEWDYQRKKHSERIENIIGDYLHQRNLQKRNPVLDFLFEYYSFRPGLLTRWSPGFGYLLKGGEAHSFPDQTCFRRLEDGITLDIRLFPEQRIDSLKWILNLLESVAGQPPLFGCFGMHEWAMMYKTREVRHDYLPLRLSETEIDDFVESRPIICTHYDAFRFFSEKARPLNILQPEREKRKEFEQPGCLHANMDLYKWAYKFYPWTPSSLIADTFELAIEARTIDMQASPYDLSEMGLSPIKIETTAGRDLYKRRQNEVWLRGKSVRDRLIDHYRNLLNEVKIVH